MSNNKAIFMQQQRDAFYAHHFDALSQKELEQLVIRFKPKKEAQFPPPEYIYTKQFAFLTAPLSVVHTKVVLNNGKRNGEGGCNEKMTDKEEDVLSEDSAFVVKESATKESPRNIQVYSLI